MSGRSTATTARTTSRAATWNPQTSGCLRNRPTYLVCLCRTSLIPLSSSLRASSRTSPSLSSRRPNARSVSTAPRAASLRPSMPALRNSSASVATARGSLRCGTSTPTSATGTALCGMSHTTYNLRMNLQAVWPLRLVALRGSCSTRFLFAIKSLVALWSPIWARRHPGPTRSTSSCSTPRACLVKTAWTLFELMRRMCTTTL
mmetsp:Transcript_1263/g.3102  ORF Transcript_1263/g.3102 Transcript_1263/m.3102 type:complete len:203 (-) Transcript_1263:1750-2358(-)